nr:hypothetical protein [uncultured Desulfobulbus sp.]
MKDQTEKTFYQIKGKVREDAKTISKNEEEKVEIITEKKEGKEQVILGDIGGARK